MTYLAVEMSLYLASAAVIGVALGWLFWGQSRHRQIAKLHREMTSALEEERRVSDDARHDLRQVKANLDRARETEKTNTAKAVAEVQQLLELEKLAASTAKAEAEQLRSDMDTALSAERASASNALREAVGRAERLEFEIDLAKSRETQVRAELEELRLMAGAEKLAAQSARSEAEHMRQSMQASLDAERATSADALQALSDIQTTLARTLGAGAPSLDAVTARPEQQKAEATSPSSLLEIDVPSTDDGESPTSEADIEQKEAASQSTAGQAVMLSGIDVTPGTSFDVREEAVVANDEPQPASALAETTGTFLTPVAKDAESTNIEQDPEPASNDNINDENGTLSLPETAPCQPDHAGEPPTSPSTSPKPDLLYEERPENVDNLREIEGIDADLEKLLNAHGCYQFKQLARLSPDDVDWLALHILSVPDLKDRIAREGWIDKARELQAKRHLELGGERPRWWSRRRLK